AVAVLDHVLELVPEVLDEALHGPSGCIAERADRVAFDLVRDIDEHVEVLLAALARQDSAQHAIHPAGAFAARRALTARFGVVEPRDALQDAHHAGGFVHHDHRTGAERRADLAQTVVVHRDVHHDLAWHDRHRGSAGNHRLELASAAHAAADLEQILEGDA